MKTSKNVLVAVDDSEASRRAVAYTAELLDGAPGARVSLFHLELPPRMLDWGGAEDPAVERKVDAERAVDYRDMEARRETKGDTLLKRMQELFTRRGGEIAGRYVRFEEPLNASTVSQAILDAAQAHECGTIVVGQHSFSGLKRWFQHHVGEELVRKGSGIAVWIVD